MELLRNTKNKITKDRNSKDLPHLEITEVVLVDCNISDNNYQHDAIFLYIFVPNKSVLINH